MKKDINFSPATGIKLAIAKEVKEHEISWGAYLINLNLIELHTLLVSSKGYGELEGEFRKTSTLRHMIEQLGPQCVTKIESLDPAIFSLTQEFWVSYYILDQVFDKKFIFTPDSFDPSSLEMIPELGLVGVLRS